MADLTSIVTANYDTGAILDRIKSGLAKMGVDPEKPFFDDLKLADEFHVGGVQATEMLLLPLQITETTRVLDLGCGIGGPARFMAHNFGCKVTGVDLTPIYVETGQALSKMTGLAGLTELQVGSATDLPMEDETFDLVTMLHVGMNIPDKPAIFAEAARVLAPGGRFFVYEIMRTGDGTLPYPMPWAAVPEGSFVEPAESYLAAADAAGLTCTSSKNHRGFAQEFFKKSFAAIKENGPPPVGLHLIMGESGPVRLQNLVKALNDGLVAPLEMLFQKSRA